MNAMHSVLAQASELVGQTIVVPSRTSLFFQHLLAAISFSIIGILVLLVTLWIMNRYAPFSLHREIEEDQNVAVGIVVGSILLGISIIIAAAIAG